MKKIILLLLLMIPLITAAKSVSARIGGIWYTILLHNNTCWVSYAPEGYPEYSGDIVIPSSVTFQGQIYQVTKVEMIAFAGYKNVTSIVLPEGLTEIQMSAFDGCSNLRSVSLPSTLMSIEDRAFAGCENLNQITCLAIQVPQTSNSIFEGINTRQITLVVSQSAQNAYKASPIWNTFKFK